mmetsp:Transcript_26206/g.62572  ORF Transcript_26206/g.62572 Transcript_26206/m.62572 type:complete len:261 (+) Transcript_26206:276-1058(+)
MMTVSAAVRLMPIPPARVDRRNTEMPTSLLNSSIIACRSCTAVLPSSRMYRMRRGARNSSRISSTFVHCENIRIRCPSAIMRGSMPFSSWNLADASIASCPSTCSESLRWSRHRAFMSKSEYPRISVITCCREALPPKCWHLCRYGPISSVRSFVVKCERVRRGWFPALRSSVKMLLMLFLLAPFAPFFSPRHRAMIASYTSFCPAIISSDTVLCVLAGSSPSTSALVRRRTKGCMMRFTLSTSPFCPPFPPLLLPDNRS